MIKIGICDDERASRKVVGELLRGYFRDKNMECQQTEYGSGKEFLERAEETDILLLDIDAGEVSGLQLKNMLQGEDIKILFMANHMEEMPEAFGRNVYGFLKKPVEKRCLEKCLSQMVEDLTESRCIVLKSLNRNIAVKLKDIFYFVSEKKYSRIVSRIGEQFCDMGLGQLEKMLEHEAFFRCHRSYLVNLRNISGIKGEIHMENGEKRPVSRRKAGKLKFSYQIYMMQKTQRVRHKQE